MGGATATAMAMGGGHGRAARRHGRAGEAARGDGVAQHWRGALTLHMFTILR